MDSANVTKAAARMLQCICVVAVARNGKDAGCCGTGPTEREKEQEEAEAAGRKIERLARELKLNWLGRSRMGRDRIGLVGSKAKPID